MRSSIAVLVGFLCFSGCKGNEGQQGKDVPDAFEITEDSKDAVPGEEIGDLGFQSPIPFKEMLPKAEGKPAIMEKVRLVLDKSLEGVVDKDKIKASILGIRIREADPFDHLTAQENWWEDYQDQVDIVYYSAEHKFSDESPYPGMTFMPHIWSDVVYQVSDVVVEFEDLSELYQKEEERALDVQDMTSKTWHLLSANDGFAWAKQHYAHAPDEMVVIVTNNQRQTQGDTSFYFIEEEYANRRGFDAYYFNTPFDQWPKAMQESEGLKAHDLPIWMHFAFLNGEWDTESKKWNLFPNTRWGGYDGTNIYFVEFASSLTLERKQCDPVPKAPASHYYLDEIAFKKCFSLTDNLYYDFYRLFRHAFNIPSYPFWWSEKVDLRVVVVDLREYDGETPEYNEDDVIDWQTFEDTVRAANPFATVTIQRFYVKPDDELRQVILKHFINEASFPLHSNVKLLKKDKTWKTFEMDWHYHFDIPGLPGMQIVIADALSHYFGGKDDKGMPKDYNPFAPPYSKSGKAFVVPALFFLTPYKAYNGRIGGWTANSGELMCIFATQFGLDCSALMDFMVQNFGQPVGPNLNDWSDVYGLWWEVFVVDWTYATSPVKTLRFLLDPAPFHDMLKSVPTVGEMLDAVASSLFDQMFGRVHPWSTGFPFWLKQSLSDNDAKNLTRQFTSYQFAESIQHNIGYKHQTTVIFDCPYLGMEDGFDYRKHKDLNETFTMTTEQATMPFYSTEPGTRDFAVDANTYMTFKMGAGTQHTLKRIFARREVVLLYESLYDAVPTFKEQDEDYKNAVSLYLEAANALLAWEHEKAYKKALEGLASLDRFLTKKGKPDVLYTDFDTPSHFEPDVKGFLIGASELDKKLKTYTGK